MKKVNYGIPSILLCVALYLMAIEAVIWPSVAAVVVVFVLNFDSKVRKTAVQALGITLIFSAVFLTMSCVEQISGTTHDYSRNIMDILENHNNQNGLYVLFTVIWHIAYVFREFACFILAILTLLKKDYFIPPINRMVDGFVQTQNQAPVNGQNPYYNNGQFNGGQVHDQQMSGVVNQNQDQNKNNQFPPVQ